MLEKQRNQEIERKFLVKPDEILTKLQLPTVITQGYLNTDPERTVRIRTEYYELEGSLSATLCIKGKAIGITRKEFEIPVAYSMGLEILNLCQKPLVEKERYIAYHGLDKWEIDVFKGQNEGLVVAEIELESEDQNFDKPEWVGEEISEDHKYSNSNLVKKPFQTWNITIADPIFEEGDAITIISSDQPPEGLEVSATYYVRGKDGQDIAICRSRWKEFWHEIKMFNVSIKNAMINLFKNIFILRR